MFDIESESVFSVQELWVESQAQRDRLNPKTLLPVPLHTGRKALLCEDELWKPVEIQSPADPLVCGPAPAKL